MLAMTNFHAVFFDIGETIVDKSREYAAWADFLDVPPHTFSAAFGGLIARGRDFREVAQLLRPDWDWNTARAAGAGKISITESDVYSDVRPVLEKLRSAGVYVGICGNQDLGIAEDLRRLDLPADLIASSAEWNTAKPDPSFFTKITTLCEQPPEQIVYVGDQWDNDVHPAHRAGMNAVRLRRGPWGPLDPDDAHQGSPLALIDSLDELPAIVLGN